MFNLKWAIGLGVAGLILSLVIGLFSGAGFPHVIVRAGIMGAVFFALGCGLWLLINNFIPELLFPETNAEAGGEGENLNDFDSPGSRVNITVDDPQNLPEIFRNLDHGNEVGNINDLVSGAFKPPPPPPPRDNPSFSEQGIDQNPQDGYTGNSSPASSASGGASASASSGGGLESPSGSGGADIGGGLGDIEGMAGFFAGPEDAGSVDAEEPTEPAERKPVGNKSEKLEGDFNPKDLAMGIRTVLSKDE